MSFNLEIELKFKCDIKKIPFKEIEKKNELKSFYVSVNDLAEVRICTKNNLKSTLTIKSRADSTIRDEFEYEIPIEEAEKLEQLKAGNTIYKTRYFLPVKKEECLQVWEGACWEIDVYHGFLEGLVVAEIEIPEAIYKSTMAFKFPEWIIEDITNDLAYKNSSLATLSND